MVRRHICFLIVLCCVHVDTFQLYQKLIPNGDHVPHSCIPYVRWRGVGHNEFTGGGQLNRFGRDFRIANKVWYDICHLDSDGDGMTNGQELGDPNCTWKKGELPERIINITNPGVCDPVTSTSCVGRNFFLKCEIEEKDCKIKYEKGMQKMVVKIPPTMLPPVRTSYVHMLFELPHDQDYHLVFVEIYPDNKELVHHLGVSGCELGKHIPLTLNEPVVQYGRQLKRIPPPCVHSIGGWDSGRGGRCKDGDYAYRIGGKTGFQKAVLRIHWNNPDPTQNHTYSSGATLYYTPVLRKHDAGVTRFSQNYLNIPPGKDRVIARASCPPSCTKLMKGPVYIADTHNHMHFLGIAMKVEVFRNGTKIAVLNNQKNYDFGSSLKVFPLANPVEVLPGDEVRGTCVFSSKYLKRATYYSSGTDGEMCTGSFTFYPAQNNPLTVCGSYGNDVRCET